MNLSTASSSLNRVREGESNILSLFFTLLYCTFLFFYLLSFTLWRFFSENGGFFSENPGNFRKNSFKTTQMKPPKVIYLAVADYVALCVSVYGSFRNLPCQITAGFAVTACVTLCRSIYAVRGVLSVQGSVISVTARAKSVPRPSKSRISAKPCAPSGFAP